MFRAPAMLMPHESTVAHEQRLVVENPEKYFRSRQGSLTPSSVAEETAVFAAKPKVVFFFLFFFTATFKSIYVSFFFKSTWVFYIDCVFFFIYQLDRVASSVPHTRAETPRKVTHNHDEDDSEEESDKST